MFALLQLLYFLAVDFTMFSCSILVSLLVCIAYISCYVMCLEYPQRLWSILMHCLPEQCCNELTGMRLPARASRPFQTIVWLLSRRSQQHSEELQLELLRAAADSAWRHVFRGMQIVP